MNGVEILAAHEVMATTFNWYVFVIGMGVIIGLMSLLAWNYLPGEKTTNILVGLFCSLLFVGPIGIIASCTGEKVPDYVEYKVQLSDEVPIADFLSTYEIIGQEGQILTIREKEFAENG
jgi:hypothetical protein